MSIDAPEAAVERRKNDPWREDLSKRVMALEKNNTEMKVQLDKNTEVTEETNATVSALSSDLSGIVKISKQVDGTLSPADGFGKFALWVAKVSGMVLILWAIIKYVILEALKKPA